jgi:hypothetical protein
MRQLDPPQSVIDAAARSRSSLRRLLMWSHLVVGCATLLVYLSSIDFEHSDWWTRSRGRLLLIFIAAVVAPYVASAIHCWQLYTWQMNGPSRTRVAGFIAVLVAGSVLASAVRLRFFPYTETTDAFLILGAQVGIYFWGAEWLLNVI